MVYDTICAKEVLTDSSQTAHFNVKSASLYSALPSDG